MKLLLAVCLITYCYALDCSKGQQTWCSSLRAANECGAFNHCKDTVWRNIELSQDSSDLCEFCESIVGDVRKQLVDKKTQAQIKAFLDSACSIIPDSDLQSECQDVVDNDLPQLLMLISEELDPSLVCGSMGLCQSAAIFMRAPKVQTTPKQVAASGNICTDCKTFMTDIMNEITSETTVTELEEMIDNLFCAQLGSLEDTCKQLAAQYAPEILEMLADDVDPTMECEALGFCPATAAAKLIIPKLRLKASSLYRAHIASNDEMCDTCKEAITVVKTMATSPDVEAEIENTIDQMLCSKLGQYSSLCTDTVKQYLPEIMQLLSSELDPEQDCEALGMCSAESYPLYDLLEASITEEDIKAMQESGPKMSNVGASTECILCEFVIDRLDRMLTANATEQEIIKALDTVCSLLPSTIADECAEFVNTYGPAVLALLSQEVSPQVICSALGLCQSDVLDLTENGGELCTVCETLVQYVESLISENATEHEIIRVLDKVCNFLPDIYKSECNDIINQYTPDLIKLLQQELSPKEICTAIDLCSSEETINPKTQPLLGAKECTWGPAYWCASRENAAKCNAEEHCMNHVWN